MYKKKNVVEAIFSLFCYFNVLDYHFEVQKEKKPIKKQWIFCLFYFRSNSMIFMTTKCSLTLSLFMYFQYFNCSRSYHFLSRYSTNNEILFTMKFTSKLFFVQFEQLWQFSIMRIRWKYLQDFFLHMYYYLASLVLLQCFLQWWIENFCWLGICRNATLSCQTDDQQNFISRYPTFF